MFKVIKDYAEQQSRLLRDILTFQQRNIQTAAEREDQERARLEKLAIEAAEARQKKLEEQNQENSTMSNVGDEKVPPEEEQPTHSCSSSNVQWDNEIGREVSECGSPSVEPVPPVTHSTGEQLSSGLPRPTVLLPGKGLQPQESLDSPQPMSNKSIADDNSTQSDEATPTKSQKHRNLPLAMPGEKLLPANTPAEMLLSPQYYPKQLARKIFSVTQVNEDSCSSSALPLSETDSGEFDPLNICRLHPDLSSSTSEPYSTPPKLGTSDLLLSTSLDGSKSHHGAVISPTTLVRDMADETAKQIVSINEEVIATAHDQLCLSSENKAPSEDSLPSFSSTDQGSFDICFPSNTEEIICCDSNMPSFESDENRGSFNTICPSSHDMEEGINSLQDLSFLSESDLKASGECSQVEVVLGKGDNFVDVEEPESIVPSVMKRENGLSENLSGDILCISNTDAPDTEEKDSLTSSDYKSYLGVEERKSSEREPVQKDVFESAAHGDALPQDSSLLKSPADSFDNHQGKTGYHSLSEEQKGIAKKCSEKGNDDLGKPDSKSNQVNSLEPISKSDSQSSFSEIDSVLEIDNVDLSLEEEPWTAVDGDDDSKVERGGHQPDFFTTLSMNGLTQELASALTSLDGSSLDEDASK